MKIKQSHRHNSSTHQLRKPLMMSLFIASMFNLGCGLDIPEYSAGDHIDFELGFSKDNLSDKYLTDTHLELYIDGPEAERFAIEVSDESLLAPITEEQPHVSDTETGCEDDVSGNCVPQTQQEELRAFSRKFAVKQTGEVTIKFSVDGDVFLKKTVTLVDANDFSYNSELTANEPQMVAVDGKHVLRIVPMHDNQSVGFGQISNLPELPQGVSVHTGFSTRELVISVRPQEVGLMEFELKLGGKSIPLKFQAVEQNEITQFTVINEGPYEAIGEDEQEIKRGESKINASLTSPEGEETTLHGAFATWTRNDTGESVSAAIISYEHSDTELVPFTVSIGELSQEVMIPMNPQSELNGFDVSSCDASGGRQSGLLLLGLLLGAMGLRRQAIA